MSADAMYSDVCIQQIGAQVSPFPSFTMYFSSFIENEKVLRKQLLQNL